MSDEAYLVCPTCERVGPAIEEAPCPSCGSHRTYLHDSPALPDAASEAYVKLDADEAGAGSTTDGETGESGSDEGEE